MASKKLLHNMVTLITGAGSGYGAGIAKLFAEEGASVVVLDINEQGGLSVVSELKDLGHTAWFVKLNVTVASDWKEAIQAVKSRFGRIDVLVNNAGWTYRRKSSLEVTELEFDRVFETNVKGIFHSVNAVIPVFVSQGSGCMINISSCLTSKPVNGLLYYVATKGAVDILTRGLALEYADQGIRVSGVSPSMGNTALAADFIGQEFNRDIQGAKAAQIPLGRLCTPLDVAKACLYLASPYFNDFQTYVKILNVFAELIKLTNKFLAVKCYELTGDNVLNNHDIIRECEEYTA